MNIAEDDSSVSGKSSLSGRIGPGLGKKKKANSKKMFRNSIVRQINEQRKTAKIAQFKLKADLIFYNQRIRPILLPFLSNLISNYNDQSSAELGVPKEIVFCDNNSTN